MTNSVASAVAPVPAGSEVPGGGDNALSGDTSFVALLTQGHWSCFSYFHVNLGGFGNFSPANILGDVVFSSVAADPAMLLWPGGGP